MEDNSASLEKKKGHLERLSYQNQDGVSRNQGSRDGKTENNGRMQPPRQAVRGTRLPKPPSGYDALS
jgi:hypothetical protein